MRKISVGLAVLLVILAGGAAWWYGQAAAGLYSSPTALRTNSNYVRAHASAKERPPMPTNLFDVITVTQSATEVSLSMPASITPEADADYGKVEVHRADASQTVHFAGGSLNLLYIATAYLEPPVTNIGSGRGSYVAGKYFRPDLTPIGTNEMTDRIPLRERKHYARGDYPTGKFFFTSSNLVAPQALKASAFDATTHTPLNSGHSRAALGHEFWIESRMRLWHQTPIELVVTVATGPAQDFTIAPTEGARLDYPGGHIRLLTIVSNDLGGWSSSHDGKSNKVTMEIRSEDQDSDGPTASFVFFHWPTAASIPVTVFFYDKEGKQVTSSGNHTSEHLQVMSVNRKAEEIAKIEVRYMPNVHRLIFTLPELPGLPEENRDVENLFDVKIPVISFSYPYSFQQTICELMQMKPGFLPLTYPPAMFPAVWTNTTPAELFQEMSLMVTNQELRLVADPEKNTVSVQPHPFYVLFEKIKKKFGL